jgi:zinc transport system substrate-binding protein
MKKVLSIILFSTFAFAKIHVVVTVLPQKLFVDKIGGEKVETNVMVESGASPHSYSPKPSQMRTITQADIYFTIGVEFEEIWLKKFVNQNRDLLVIDSAKDIEKNRSNHHHHEIDPHIWVNPVNVKIIAKNITKALISQDQNNSQYYQKNLKLFLTELENLDLKIKKILAKVPKNSAFMVFHPSWGYFASQYGLRQIAVEVEGKEPKMKALVQLMKKAKKEKIRAIFAQPEFSDKSVNILAKNLHINVVKVSPLAENWADNLIYLAKTIADKGL